MLKIFTSGRDYRPAHFWDGRLPAHTVYARVLVAAPDLNMAGEILAEAGLIYRYGETLTEASHADGPAQVVLRMLCDGDPPRRHATHLFVLYRQDHDALGDQLPHKLLLLRGITGGDLNIIGKIVVADQPDRLHPNVMVVPDDGGDDVAVPDWAEGPSLATMLVDGVIAYPDGREGARLRNADRWLFPDLIEVAEGIAAAAHQIEDNRRSTDPRTAWRRQQRALKDLAVRLAEIRALAGEVEDALKPR